MKTELEKMEGVRERSQAIGEFLEWLFSTKNYHIAKYLSDEEYESDENVDISEPLWEGDTPFRRHRIREGESVPIPINIEKLLAEFFEIDLAQVEKERREILGKIKEKQ